MALPASSSIPHSAPSISKPPRVFTVAWILLLIVGAFIVLAAVLDLLADATAGLPSDHLGAFGNIAGVSWKVAKQTSPGITQYITLLEVAYAVHELVFGLLFLIIVAIPFRRQAHWAWWACWAVMLANITYSLTFGSHDSAILVRSLVVDIAVPVLLLIQLPFFLGSRARKPVEA